MKKVINKGYTISVTSWENDGDNYNTKSMTVESEDEAKAITEMCNTLFKSSNNGERGIGNLMDDEGESAKELIAEFMLKHPILIQDFLKRNPELANITDFEEIEDIDEHKLDELVNICMGKYNYPLMGGSEYYYSRVCEICEVTYSDIDISTKELSLEVFKAKEDLIKLLENQVEDLSMMSKIELGDDVIKEILRLKAIIGQNKDE